MVVTAKEFLKSSGITGQQAETIANWMIQFAKLHVEEALREASEKATKKSERWKNISGWHEREVIDKNSILNAYPPEKIK